MGIEEELRRLMAEAAEGDWQSCLDAGLSLVWGAHDLVDVPAGVALVKAAAVAGHPDAIAEIETLPPFAKSLAGLPARDKSATLARARSGDIGAVLEVYFRNDFDISEAEMDQLLRTASSMGSVTADELLASGGKLGG